MYEFKKVTPPKGDVIRQGPNGIESPEKPIIPFIRGEGIGPEIWESTQAVADETVHRVYNGKRSIVWFEIYAGESAAAIYGVNELLPADTLEAIRRYKIAIKGPLATPVGGGARSVNVALRRELDLYANVRPVRYFPGLPSPLKSPEKIDLVIFRENTEDVYMGFEWPAESAEAWQIIDLVNSRLLPQHVRLHKDAAIGLKPITRYACERLVRAAIEYAKRNGYPSVTLVHKGNIMKFTEGAFVQWGYELARAEFNKQTLTEAEFKNQGGDNAPADKIIIKDRIADAMFQELILRPDRYGVIAATNLNGDYLSDAAAALVGGLGFASSANIGDGLAVFEAVHGTAPDIAGKGMANPSSLILSAIEMFRYLGWVEAAEFAFGALKRVISRGCVTADVSYLLPNATSMSCREFTAAVVNEIRQG